MVEHPDLSIRLISDPISIRPDPFVSKVISVIVIEMLQRCVYSAVLCLVSNTRALGSAFPFENKLNTGSNNFENHNVEI